MTDTSLPDDARTARRKRQRENQEYFSGKVSELARYVGFGLVAASFSLLSRATDFSKGLSHDADNLLGWAALLGILAVLLDYLQMLAGWLAAQDAANNAAGDYHHRPAGVFFRTLQAGCFYAKQALALVGVIGLLVALATRIELPRIV